MKYCKNSACKGAGGYRRKKKSGFGGYCWTCGLQFEPTRAAAAIAKFSCKNIACKGADGNRRHIKNGLGGCCWVLLGFAENSKSFWKFLRLAWHC